MAISLSSGSPGPLDKTIASKFLDKILLELVLQGRTVTLHPLLTSELIIFCFEPKSNRPIWIFPSPTS